MFVWKTTIKAETAMKTKHGLLWETENSTGTPSERLGETTAAATATQ